MNYNLHKLANEILGIERTHIPGTNYKLRIIVPSDSNVKVLDSNDNIKRPIDSPGDAIQYNLGADTYKIIVYTSSGETYYSEYIIVNEEMYNTIYTLNTIKGDDNYGSL